MPSKQDPAYAARSFNDYYYYYYFRPKTERAAQL